MSKHTCQICDKKVTIGRKDTRDNWRVDKKCRVCKDVLELFNWNGNRLREYIDESEFTGHYGIKIYTKKENPL